MKNEIDVVFSQLKKKKRKALIAYLAAGYPRFPEERRLFKTLVENGVDLLELGVPFSDPIADGPTIQFASQQSLEGGTTLKKILKWVKILKGDNSTPIILMSYINPVLAFGLKTFSTQARAAGVAGLIIPDLIPEEGRDIEQELRKNNIHLIYLVSPTTPSSRLKMIAQRTGGFLYAVSVAGVTGARRGFSKTTASWLKSLKRFSSRPVCVGFGISRPEHIQTLRPSVDGFIVGSALIDCIRSHASSSRVRSLRELILSLSKEC